MKKLSIEDKAKRYDEAFRIAQELYNDHNSSNIGKGYVCTVFPELQESDDAKVKEEIKVILANTDLSQFSLDYTFADMLDWLEKQGKQKLQKQWKPSENQLRALHDLNLTGGISYAGQGQSLIELYEDLKKL